MNFEIQLTSRDVAGTSANRFAVESFDGLEFQVGVGDLKCSFSKRDYKYSQVYIYDFFRDLVGIAASLWLFPTRLSISLHEVNLTLQIKLTLDGLVEITDQGDNIVIETISLQEFSKIVVRNFREICYHIIENSGAKDWATMAKIHECRFVLYSLDEYFAEQQESSK